MDLKLIGTGGWYAARRQAVTQLAGASLDTAVN